MTLPERLARLTADLRSAALDIAHSSPQCAVRAHVANELAALADELDEFSLAVDMEDQTSARH